MAVIEILENGTIVDDCVAYGNEFLCNAKSFRNGYEKGKNDTVEKVKNILKEYCYTNVDTDECFMATVNWDVIEEELNAIK